MHFHWSKSEYWYSSYNSPMKWDIQFKYLGIIISSGKSFEIILDDIRRKFFVSVNSILSKCKYTSDLVKLNLLESHCLPILLYAMESININNYQLKLINSWWNSVYRKIFSFQKWESVKLLICLLNRIRPCTFGKFETDNVYQKNVS